MRALTTDVSKDETAMSMLPVPLMCDCLFLLLTIAGSSDAGHQPRDATVEKRMKARR
jgi:hypothetical protein